MMNLTNTRSGVYLYNNTYRDYKSLLICDASVNDYIPVYAFNDNLFKDSNNGKLIYEIVLPSETNEIVPNSKFLKAFELYKYTYTFNYEKEGLTVYVTKGLIYTIDTKGKLKILVVNTFKKNEENIFTQLRDYKIFINPAVFTDTHYSRVLYYVKKYIINEAAKVNIEITISKHIAKYCFNPFKYVKEYPSIEEMDADLIRLKQIVANTTRYTPIPEVIPNLDDIIFEENEENEENEPVLSEIEQEFINSRLSVTNPDHPTFVTDDDLMFTGNLNNDATISSTTNTINIRGNNITISPSEFSTAEEQVESFSPITFEPVTNNVSSDPIPEDNYIFTTPDVPTEIEDVEHIEVENLDEIIEDLNMEITQMIGISENNSGYGFTDDEAAILNY